MKKISLSFLAVAGVAAGAQAQVVTPAEYLFPGNGEFHLSQPVLDSSIGVVIADMDMDGLSDRKIRPRGWDGTIKGRFDATALIGPLGSPPTPISAGGDFQFDLTPDLSTPDDEWDMQISALDVTFQGGGAEYRLRESPSRPSLGKGRVAASMMSDGRFAISSFFDVFTELSIDGGQTWSPMDQPMHFDLRQGTVPEPASMALLAGGIAVLVKRRRSKS